MCSIVSRQYSSIGIARLPVCGIVQSLVPNPADLQSSRNSTMLTRGQQEEAPEAP
jgi:hypothetical protein